MSGDERQAVHQRARNSSGVIEGLVGVGGEKRFVQGGAGEQPCHRITVGGRGIDSADLCFSLQVPRNGCCRCLRPSAALIGPVLLRRRPGSGAVPVMLTGAVVQLLTGNGLIAATQLQGTHVIEAKMVVKLALALVAVVWS